MSWPDNPIGLALGSAKAHYFGMRLRCPTYVVIAAALMLSGVTLGVVSKVCTVYPSDHTKSTFLANFDPTNVVEQYVTPIERVRGRGGAAGYRYPWSHQDVAHKADLRWTFRSDPAGYQSMMTALLEEARHSLAATNAVITFEHVEGGHFTIRYSAGRTKGSIRVESPKPADNLRLHDRLTLQAKETWAVSG